MTVEPTSVGRQPWKRDELLLAFNLYCKTPFGRMHKGNADIIRLSGILGRTPSSVAMKLCNFASLDPAHQERNVSGLRNASRGDRAIYGEFSRDWEQIAFESEQARLRSFEQPQLTTTVDGIVIPDGATERTQLVRARTVQSFFRNAVLASYEYSCAMCEVCTAALLNASHIIPWSRDVKRRADPTNGIALCALHDRAFDRGLVGIDSDFRIVISDKLRVPNPSTLHRIGLIEIHGKPITLPHRFHPDRLAIEFHRQEVFDGG